MDNNGYFYDKTRKGLYSIPQAGRISNNFVTKNLAPYGYCQCCHTPVLWGNKWSPVMLPFVVDYFGVKYVGNKHAGHLITCIKKYYPVSVDWNGGLFCGLNLEWDYKELNVTLSMQRYIDR